ncbi:hypothetical protein [Halocola ammonii]
MEQAVKHNSKMELSTQQIDLIKGTFTPEEAFEILTHLIDKKINFHQVRNFSQEIRFGQTIGDSDQRLSELKASREQVKKIMQHAEETGHHVKLTSEIAISLIEKA